MADTTVDTPPTHSPPLQQEQEEKMEVEGTGQVEDPSCLKVMPINRTSASKMSPDMEAIMGSLIRQVGNMMAARFAAIEDRLLPEKSLRLPLRADKGRTSAGVVPEATDTKKNRSTATQKKKETKKKEEKKRMESKETPKATTAKENGMVPSSKSPNSQLSYADMAKKGKGKKGKG